MTIASLLKHHGVHVPRYVTVDGRIVFDGVSLGAAGFLEHTTEGPVTAIQRHEFHGGVELDEQRADSPAKWWNSPRGQVDISAMRHSFPAFELVPGDLEHPPTWRGSIDSGRGRFEVMVRGRSDQRLPIVVPQRPKKLGRPRNGLWVSSPHLFTNGNLCIADQDDWNPDKNTVADAVAWTAHWYAAYTEWRMSDRWPVVGYSVETA